MTRFKTAILILIISGVLSVFSLIFTQTTWGRLVDKLDDVIINIIKKDTDTTVENLDDAIEYFEKIKPFLNILEGQGETIEIRGNLNKAIFFVNAKNYESAVLYLEECKNDLNRIIVSNIPSISTIL